MVRDKCRYISDARGDKDSGYYGNNDSMRKSFSNSWIMAIIGFAFMCLFTLGLGMLLIEGAYVINSRR